MYALQEKFDPSDKYCGLCGGTGLDTTGMMSNGEPYTVCVRCGGYGVVERDTFNPARILANEYGQMAAEAICR